jgi:PAS domain S-box-containing protein
MSTRTRGVGTRLLVAFIGISAFSALVAGAAIYAFYEVGHSLTLIDHRIDPILASLDVSRSVERITTASSRLASVTAEQERKAVHDRLIEETNRLHSLLTALRDGGISYDQLAPIEETAVLLDSNLTALDGDVRLRLQLIGQIKDLMRGVFDTGDDIRRLLSPTLLVYDSQVARLIALTDTVVSQGEPAAWKTFQPLIAGLLGERQVQRVQQHSSDVADALAQASVSEEKQRLVVLAFQTRRKVENLEKGAEGLDTKLRPLFLSQVEKFKTLIEGSGSVIELRRQELVLIADVNRLLVETTTLSNQLTGAAAQLLDATKQEIRTATASALRVQRVSTGAITVLVALSVLASVLIVWLYVGRNILARLNRLSGTLLAVARGDHEASVTVAGSDEIAEMARAVEIFRRNSLERDELLAERAEAATRLESIVEERTLALQQRQAELRVTFDNMGDGVAMFDAGLRLVAWNRNFQELLGLPDDFLSQPHAYAEYIRYLAKSGEFGRDSDPEAELRRYTENVGRHYSFERTRPDGTILEVRHNPVPDGGFVLIYSDITERKRSEGEIRAARDAAEAAYRDLQAAQASLVQAQKMAALGQLTAGIAHEIKNPLNFVNNFASLSTELLDELKEDVAPALGSLDSDKREAIDETIKMLTGNLDKIAEHGQRADNIVKSMLEHSRGISGERREVDLNGMIEEALNLAYHGARAQDQGFNITLERDYARSLKPIDVAPQEMTRVFLNLFGNGFYAANKRARDDGDGSFRPVLTVRTRQEGDAVEVRVRDNGTGVPPEIRDKLFQPFFTTKPTGQGTGLGLSISYDIVTQQHGGTITVESEPGAYTEFTIRLPRR